MDSTTIELKLLYGRDLKVSNYFQKPVVFVEVSIAGDHPDKEVERSQQQVQRTTTVREKDGQPEWNQEMRFELTEAMVSDRDHLFLQFDLRHEGLVFGDKPIGEVRVPFTHLLEGSNGIVRFVSYEVRTPDGKANGSLNFSYKVNLKGGDSVAGMNSPPAGGNIAGYPVVDYAHFSGPAPYQAYPAPIFDAGAYPIGHEVGYSSSSPGAPHAHEVGYSPSPRAPHAHEVGYSSSSPGAPHAHEVGYSPSPRAPHAHEVGYLPSPRAPHAHEIGYLSSPGAHEIGYSSPPGAPYSSQDAHYPPSSNGFYPSPPTMAIRPAPPVAVAIHQHHHYHGPPPVNPWVSDPSGYEYGPRVWAPGGGERTGGYSSTSPSAWSGR